MTQDLHIAILGAGMSGLAMGVALKEAGFHNFTIYEKAERVGGTWRDNHYPGVACDVASHLYSFSFALNPDWSKAYSPGAEIQAYCEKTARDFGLIEHCVFNTAATAAKYEGGKWQLAFADGTHAQADITIAAMGGLHIPNIPDIAGQQDFEGASFHTAHWDDTIDLTGKRVAIIGSAASAVQVIPEIIDKVAHLDVYQRTPNWVLPRMNKTFSPFRKWLHRTLPFTALWVRFALWLRNEVLFFPAFRANSFMQKRLRKIAEQHMTDLVPDPALRAKLMPDFQVGCKRILIIDGYLEALQRDHAALITEHIARITPTGIETKDGTTHRADVIIYATGFKPFNFLDSFEVAGNDGQKLSAVWGKDVHAHRSVAVAGFPNFFMLLGPNSGLGHNSVIVMIEAEVRYIVKLIRRLANEGLHYVNPKAGAQTGFNADVREGLHGTVWQSGCKSWYQRDDGHNHTLYPYSTWTFLRDMREPDLSEYHHGGNRQDN